MIRKTGSNVIWIKLVQDKDKLWGFVTVVMNHSSNSDEIAVELIFIDTLKKQKCLEPNQPIFLSKKRHRFHGNVFILCRDSESYF